MDSIRKTLGLKEKEAKEVKKPDDEEMGWMSILSNLKQLSDSKAIKVQVRNLEKIWKPLISDLEKMVKQVQAKHMELLMPEVPDQTGSPDPIKQFLAVTDKMVTKAKGLMESMESVDYDLYFVEDEKAAKAVTAENAVIMYKNRDGNYYARVIAKRSSSISEDVDRIVTDVPIKLIKQCETLKRNGKNEVIITEDNVDLVESTTKELVKAAGIKIPKKKIKKLLSGALTLANDVPVFLDAFAKLPIVPMIKDRLDKFKVDAEQFDFSNMLKAVLPIEMYKQLKEKAFDALNSAEFKSLSRDKQAAALALMESYNTAIKFAVLAMDKIEIENGLVAGALSTKISIIDNKSLKELCEEFNEAYIAAMATAKFPVHTELYPYNSSILEQRKAMLAALPPEDQKNESKLAMQKKLIQERIDILGDVKELPKREDPEDFYGFMQRTLRENYKKLEELKRQLAPEAEISGGEVKSVDITKEAKSIISKAEKELKEVLDERIFQTYFINETVADKKSPWVQQVANAFHNVKKIMAKIERLQQQHPELLASDTPFQHLEHRVTEMSELAAAGAELLTALNQIKGNAHLKKLISIPILEGMAMGSEWKKQAAIAASEAKSVSDYIKQSGTPLTAVIKALEITITKKAKTAGVELHDETIVALKEVTGLTRSLELLYKGLDKEAKEQPNLLAFAATHFTQIIDIVSSLPKILFTLNKLAKDDAMRMASEINSALKQMVLLADKLEIQFCLKEGYLTDKLRPMMMSYYAEVNKLGYDFMANDRYPFFAAIAEQRAQLLTDKNSPAFQKSLISARMRSATTLEQKEKHRINLGQVHQSLQEKFKRPTLLDAKKQEKQEEIKQEIIDVVSKHIERLQFLKERAKFINDPDAVREVGIKVRLLTRFKEIASTTQSVDVEKILQQLRKEDAGNIHLLYESTSGEILKQLEYKSVSPDDLFKALDIELAQLKKQRGTTHYIYSMHKAKLLEERINACEKLQHLVKNHNLSDTLAGLDFNEKSLLEKYDHVFLDKLKLIEQAIPVEHQTKTIIGAVEAKNDPVQVAVVDVNDSADQKYALELIDRRLAELESAIFKTNTKRLKIEVLTALKEELKQPGVSLQAAINKIKMNQQTKDTAYLIFEGRTGKTIKAAQNMTITRTELVHRLDAEINDLKRQRYAHLHVFAQSRKATGDEHIEVLQKLRAAIKGSEKSVRDIIINLTPAEKNVLQRYDADLLKDFNAFEKVTSKQLGAR